MRDDIRSATENSFYVREDILSVLLKSAKDIEQGYRHNIALIGKGLIGKSPLLLHFLNIIDDCKKLMPLYINLKGTNFTEFILNYIDAVLRCSLSKKTVIRPRGDTQALKSVARLKIPKTYDLIKKIERLLKDKEFDDAFSAVLDLNIAIGSETGGYPVVVIDEFNLLSGFPLKAPFQVLGQKIMVQQKALFVLSSSSTITAKKILSEKLSMLFGGFDILDIGPFCAGKAKEIIKNHLKDVIMPEDLVDFLAAFTGGHPFYLNSAIRQLNAPANESEIRVSAKHLSEVIADLLFAPNGAINQFFLRLTEESCLDMPNGYIFDILKLILSTGDISDMAKTAPVSPAEAQHAINSLLEAGIISRSGSLYIITDPVFKVWARVKSRPRNLLFDFMQKESAKDYAREIFESIGYFNAEKRKAPKEKIIELISCFNNDRFFIDERIRVLPALSNVILLDNDNIITAYKSKKAWIFILREKNVSEDDIRDMYKKVKDLNYKNPKVILISPADVDISAKLFAKQKGIWVWNKNDLGRLFEFYKGYNILTA